MARRKKPSRQNFQTTPRWAKCELCSKRFDLNGFGYLVNGNGTLLCSDLCFSEERKKQQRIRDGEARWDDL